MLSTSVAGVKQDGQGVSTSSRWPAGAAHSLAGNSRADAETWRQHGPAGRCTLFLPVFRPRSHWSEYGSGYPSAGYPFDAHCCHTGTAIKHPVSDWVKLSFVIFDTQALWVSECPDVKNYKWRLNPVWHRMLYSCTLMATVDGKGLLYTQVCMYSNSSRSQKYRFCTSTSFPWNTSSFVYNSCFFRRENSKNGRQKVLTTIITSLLWCT